MPDQPAEKRRRQLRDGGKRQQADRGELGVAGRAVIQISQRRMPKIASRRTVSSSEPILLAAGDHRPAPLQHQRHDDVVRHHDRERHRFHDHHGGRRRQAADESDDGEHVRSALQRQRQHEHVAVHRAGRKRDQAGNRDRHHEQIDQHEIERKQPGGALDLGFVVVLDHRHVELARQQNDRHERQQRGRHQRVDARLAREDAGGRADAASPRQTARPGPPNIQKVMKMPTARKATSLTIDSVAIASIRPSWCSVASIWRVPNSTAKVAIDIATNSAMSPSSGLATPLPARHCARIGLQRGRHRLELQCDIGNGADDGDQRDGGGDRLALAVARGDEVGDRGDVLRLGQPHDADDQRREQSRASAPGRYRW